MNKYLFIDILAFLSVIIQISAYVYCLKHREHALTLSYVTCIYAIIMIYLKDFFGETFSYQSILDLNNFFFIVNCYWICVLNGEDRKKENNL